MQVWLQSWVCCKQKQQPCQQTTRLSKAAPVAVKALTAATTAACLTTLWRLRRHPNFYSRSRQSTQFQHRTFYLDGPQSTQFQRTPLMTLSPRPRKRRQPHGHLQIMPRLWSQLGSCCSRRHHHLHRSSRQDVKAWLARPFTSHGTVKLRVGSVRHQRQKLHSNV